MVQWIKDGNVIDDNDAYTSFLILSSTNANTTGIYNCTAVVGSNSEYIVDSDEVSSSMTKDVFFVSG